MTICLASFGCTRQETQPEPNLSSDAGATEKPSPAIGSEDRAEDPRKTVLFLGDSLSAGYGLDSAQAFPALIQEKIDARGWDFKVVNAGVSGDTTAGGLRRLDWLLKRPVDVLFLELGGNDGLRGVALQETRRNLQAIIERTRAEQPDAAIVVAGMMVPPNMGPVYSEGFRSIFSDLAQENDAVLIPFLLEGVAGRPELNLPDGIHPTPEGHRIVADHVWTFLMPVLQARRGDRAAANRSSTDARASGPPRPATASSRRPTLPTFAGWAG